MKTNDSSLCENLFNENYLRYHMASILILEVVMGLTHSPVLTLLGGDLFCRMRKKA
jgi:hypothetical protein